MATLPPDAEWGEIHPEGTGPFRAEDFEALDVDEDNPIELIGGGVLPMAPGNLESGEADVSLSSVLRPVVKARGWRLSADARHRLPKPPNTVVHPDFVIHATPQVEYLKGTKTVGRVPELVLEILSEGTHERDEAPHGVKFLAYQMSGVREYYYAWPDGRNASGFELRKGVFVPLKRDRDGFFQSPLLGCALRLVDAATR